MRSLLLALVCGLLVCATVGCSFQLLLEIPPRRTQELMFTSENLRLFLDEWERAWLLRSTRPLHTIKNPRRHYLMRHRGGSA